MRRGQALKFQKDFDLAIADFEEGKKLQMKDEGDADKWIKLAQNDKLHHQKLDEIMANAGQLAGKEYIDYLLAFLQGKKDDIRQVPKKIGKKVILTVHELTQEELKKLTKTLEDENMKYYFSVNEGFKLLVDSLYLNTNALPLLESLLDKNEKHHEAFQKDHLYEALIDFMQVQNKDKETKTLSSADMLIILYILEAGSLTESVRVSLSDKKKIKDLFLVVINTIEISKNKALCSSLVQFFSNLCYGTGMLLKMLARENANEIISLLKLILDQIKVEQKYEVEDDEEENSENKAPNA
jgi:hypothetical protein